MFTGLIEETGIVKNIISQGQGKRFTIEASKVLEDITLGVSIAVNGVCLTAAAYGKSSFVAEVMPETLKQSVLKTLQPGDCVNLERALRLNEPLGGHFVTGHVDGIGQIKAIKQQGDFFLLTIEIDPENMRYILPRGSVSVNGISLTITAAYEKEFMVSIIPHTFKETNLCVLETGDKVNLEYDILGKYVERMLVFQKKLETKIDAGFLAEHGFMGGGR